MDPTWRKGISKVQILKFMADTAGAIRLGFDATKIRERLEFGWTIWGLIGFPDATYSETEVLAEYAILRGDEMTIGKFVHRPEDIQDGDHDALSTHLKGCRAFFTPERLSGLQDKVASMADAHATREAKLWLAAKSRAEKKAGGRQSQKKTKKSKATAAAAAEEKAKGGGKGKEKAQGQGTAVGPEAVQEAAVIGQPQNAHKADGALDDMDQLPAAMDAPVVSATSPSSSAVPEAKRAVS
eukprot:3938431-Rhodomonas_salina.2